MFQKSVLHAIVILFTVIVAGPTRAGDIISCDSFEHCPDGSVPLNNLVFELRTRVAELEIELIARTADLTGSVIAGATRNFINVKLSHAKLDTYWDNVDLSGADLTHADLSGAGWFEVDLTGADLSDANLATTILKFSKLIGAVLHDTDLTGADLTGSDLTNADLTNADLTGAILVGTTLTSVTWSNTTCPDGSNTNGNGSGTCVALP